MAVSRPGAASRNIPHGVLVCCWLLLIVVAPVLFVCVCLLVLVFSAILVCIFALRFGIRPVARFVWGMSPRIRRVLFLLVAVPAITWLTLYGFPWLTYEYILRGPAPSGGATPAQQTRPRATSEFDFWNSSEWLLWTTACRRCCQFCFWQA